MSQTEALISEAENSNDLYSKLVFRALSKFKRGRLSVCMPDGSVVQFGETDEIECMVTVKSHEFFKRLVLFGDIGFGESYVDGRWSTENLTDVIRWMILNWEFNVGISGSSVRNIFLGFLRFFNRFQHILRSNHQSGSLKNISAHYDLSNELFQSFLDPSMTYSCADFSMGARDLEEAQRDKFERMAKSARIKPTDRVLEIGGGWGAFAIHLTTKYGCTVDSITVSKNQFQYFSNEVKKRGLNDKIRVHFLDYRNVVGEFDKVVSIEMLEAVGHEHLPDFFSTLNRVLKPGGLVALQFIHCADSRYEQLRGGVDWIQKHIFPGSLLLSINRISQVAQKVSGLQLHELYSMGDHYVRTLKEWRERFNLRNASASAGRDDDSFRRKWNYYFSYCEAAFAMRHIGVVQAVYTRPNNLQL